jgi:hypothetical protein
MNVVEKINYIHLQMDSPGCLSSCGLAGQNQSRPHLYKRHKSPHYKYLMVNGAFEIPLRFGG